MAPLTLTDEAIERVEALAAADASAQILRDGLAALPEEQREAVLARVPHGVRWVRLNGTIGALADGNVVHVVGKVWPFTVAFERDVPRVAVLNATRTPLRATRLAYRLEPVLGRFPFIAAATRQAGRSIVIVARPQDATVAQAIARWIGATLVGPPSTAQTFGAPEDAGVVVVIGARMR
jgi:hypothetical protein